MSANPQPDKASLETAEEILRTIYGDDFKGCKVALESIAQIIGKAAKQRETPTEALLELYENVVEAVHLLSTPPDSSKVSDPKELHALLGERLDTIRGITTKTIETTRRFKQKEGGEEFRAPFG